MKTLNILILSFAITQISLAQTKLSLMSGKVQIDLPESARPAERGEKSGVQSVNIEIYSSNQDMVRGGSACGSGETTPGSKAVELREAFRSHVYLGWNNEVAMQQATLAEVEFFKVFKDEQTVRFAVDAANRIEPTKSDRAWMETEPVEDRNIANLIRFENKDNDGTYTAKELIETPHPGPVQSP